MWTQTKEYLEIASRILEHRAKWDNNLPIEKRKALMAIEDKLNEELEDKTNAYFLKHGLTAPFGGK